MKAVHWSMNSLPFPQLFAMGQLTPEALEAFQREVFVMNCLRHPNVVLLMGACQTPPKLAIIMEYVAGGSLHKVCLLAHNGKSQYITRISHSGYCWYNSRHYQLLRVCVYDTISYYGYMCMLLRV